MVGIVLWLLAFGAAPPAGAAEPAEPFLRRLPPGVFLLESVVVSPDQTAAIAQKLDGQIRRLSNSRLNVQGAAMKVNCITASTEKDAARIHRSLNKSAPFAIRRGNVIVELTGKGVEHALAEKALFELGLVEKPAQVYYAVEARLGVVEEADYMQCNSLYNLFLALDRGDATVRQEIASAASRFTFGSRLTLRSKEAYTLPPGVEFSPAPVSAEASEATTRYMFDHLDVKNGVPYVDLALGVRLDDSGFTLHSEPPGPGCMTPTAFWPTEHDALVRLAKGITSSASTRQDKVAALLSWLQPGKNIRIGGPRGSRHGVLELLKLKQGHCWDFSDLFITLARASGIPCRQVAGWLYGTGGHVWAEYHVEDRGWQQVDPTGGGNLLCGIYHIPMFTTETGEMPILYVARPSIRRVTDPEKIK